VTARLDIRAHTIRTVPERMRKLKTDPLAEVLELSPDLGAALERLMGSSGDGGRRHVIPSEARDLARTRQGPSLRSG
jgi:hypothetical protein